MKNEMKTGQGLGSVALKAVECRGTASLVTGNFQLEKEDERRKALILENY